MKMMNRRSQTEHSTFARVVSGVLALLTLGNQAVFAAGKEVFGTQWKDSGSAWKDSGVLSVQLTPDVLSGEHAIAFRDGTLHGYGALDDGGKAVLDAEISNFLGETHEPVVLLKEENGRAVLGVFGEAGLRILLMNMTASEQTFELLADSTLGFEEQPAVDLNDPAIGILMEDTEEELIAEAAAPSTAEPTVSGEAAAPNTAEPAAPSAEAAPNTAEPTVSGEAAAPSTAEPAAPSAEAAPNTAEPAAPSAEAAPNTAEPAAPSAEAAPTTAEPAAPSAEAAPNTAEPAAPSAEAAPTTAAPDTAETGAPAAPAGEVHATVAAATAERVTLEPFTAQILLVNTSALSDAFLVARDWQNRVGEDKVVQSEWLITNGSVLAGDSAQLTIYYAPQAAPEYQITSNVMAQCFTEYDSITLMLTVPEGLTLMDGGKPVLTDAEGNAIVSGQPFPYLVLDDVLAASGGRQEISMTFRVANDGTVQTSRQLSVGASWQYRYTVKDASGNAMQFPNSTYFPAMKDGDAFQTAVTSTEVTAGVRKEEWMLEKSGANSADTKVDSTSDAEYIWLSYNVDFGLDGGKGISGDQSIYDAAGRRMFSGYTIAEVLSAAASGGVDDIISPEQAELFLRTASGTGQKLNAELSAADATGARTLSYSGAGAYSMKKWPAAGESYAKLDAEFPYYTGYTVRVAYPKSEFQYDMAAGTSAKYSVTNTTRVTYTFAGAAAGVTLERPLTLENKLMLDENESRLVLRKEIDVGGNTNMRFDAAAQTWFPGTAQFAIFKADGTTQVKTAEIDPAKGEEAVVFLPAGTYVIRETGVPEGTKPADAQTITVKTGSMEVVFVNKLQGAGSVAFQKVDAANANKGLSGAEFSLAPASGTGKTYKAVSGEDGSVLFANVVPGTYTLTETTAPEGYLLPATGFPAVTVENGKSTNLGTITNDADSRSVTIQKYARYYNEEGTLVNGTTPLPTAGFAFTIEQKLQSAPESAWTAYKTGVFANAPVLLPLYQDGNRSAPYAYRVVETAAAGGYVLDATPVTVGNEAAVRLYNTRLGSLLVQKTWSDASTASPEFKLYKKTEAGFTALNATALDFGNGGYIFADLPAMEDGKAAEYYLGETAMADYVPVMDGKALTAQTIDGKMVYLSAPITVTGNTAKSIAVKNVLQKLNVTVEKVDAASLGTRLASAQFQLFRLENGVEQPYPAEGKNTVTTGAVSPLPSELGLVRLNGMPVGTYVLRETKAPQNYALSSTPVTFTVSAGADGAPVLKLGEAVQKNATLTVKNTMLPQFTLTKNVKGPAPAAGKGSTNTFAVYTKNEAGTIVPYLDAFTGEQKTFALEVPLSGTKAVTLHLPEGSYYLAEAFATTDFISTAWSSFAAHNQDNAVDATTSYGTLFGPFTVAKTGASAGTITNYTNYASVTVQKVDSMTKKPLANAKFEVTGGNATYTTAATNAAGEATVLLPVYNAQGVPVQYTLTETAAPLGYAKSTEELAFSIKADGTLQVGADSVPKLTVLNDPSASISAHMMWKNRWDEAVNGENAARLPLSGAEMGLYYVAPGATEAILVAKKSTGRDGYVTFAQKDLKYAPLTALPTDATYYVAQMNMPTGYSLPANHVLAKGDFGSKLPVAALEGSTDDKGGKYNAAKVTFTDSKDVTAQTLYNYLSWVQLQVQKYGVPENTPAAEFGTAKTPLSGVSFHLYMQDIPKYGGAAGELNFNPNAAGVTKVNATDYITGSANGGEQDVLPGVFNTAILKPDKIYWLVESGTDAAASKTMMDKSGKEYKAVALVPQALRCSAGAGVLLLRYNDGERTPVELYNVSDGGGGGTAKHAYIMADKVLKTDAAATALNGVTYGVYLLKAANGGTNAENMELLTTMTTGLDVDVSGGAASGKPGRALSVPLDVAALRKDFPDAFTPDAAKAGEFTMQLALVELSAPANVTLDSTPHLLTINTADVAPGTDYVMDKTYTTDRQNALVNTPAQGQSVRIQKVGYVQNAKTWDANNDDSKLAYMVASTERTPLSGVGLKFQKKNEKGWYADYPVNGTSAILTTGAGGYTATITLPVGEYQLIEQPLPDAHKGIYENTHTGGGAYMFRIAEGASPLEIVLFNPEMPFMKVVKVDANGTPVPSFTVPFTVKSVTRNNVSTSTEGVQSGAAVRVAPGSIWNAATVTITEEIADPWNPTELNSRFMTNIYTHLYGGGAVLDWKNWPTNNTFEFRYPNVETGAMKILKTDESGVPLAGAQFQLERAMLAETEFTTDFKKGGAVHISGALTLPDDNRFTALDGAYQTDDSGAIELKNLLPGWYRITETDPPADHMLDATPRYVLVCGNIRTADGNVPTVEGAAVISALAKDKIFDENNTVTVQNKAYGTLALTKTFAVPENSYVTLPAEAKFTLTGTDANGNAVNQTITVPVSGATGTSHARVPDGTYTLTEQAIPGWTVTAVTGAAWTAGEAITFTVDANSRAQAISVTNSYNLAKITVNKTGGPNKTPLAGVVFELYAATPTGDVLVTGNGGAKMLTTGEDGTASVEFTLVAGATSYYLKETKTADNYFITTEKTPVTVEAGKNTEVSITNDAGLSIRVTKYGDTKDNMADGYKPALQGVGFTLARVENGQLVAGSAVTLATDASGVVTFPSLRPGEYALYEAPFGDYTLSAVWLGSAEVTASTLAAGDATYYRLGALTALSGEEPYEVTVYNEPLRTLRIMKESSDHTVMPPKATFEVYHADAAGNPVGEPVKTVTTSITGGVSAAEVALRAGDYVVRETETSAGFALPANDVRYPLQQNITIKNTNTVATLPFVNLSTKFTPALTKEGSFTSAVPNLMEAEQEVTYTLSGFADGILAPIQTLELVDNGLRYFSSKDMYNEIHQVDYTVTGLTLGAAHRMDYSKSLAGVEVPVYAKVFLVPFEGEEILVDTYLLSNETAVELPAGTTPYQGFRVMYSATNSADQAGEPAMLGTGFTAGAVMVTMQLSQQAGGAAVKPVLVVNNKATVSITGWDGVPQKLVVDKNLTLNGDASVRPVIGLTKSMAPVGKTYTIEGEAAVTLTLTNLDAAGSMPHPVVVDMLPATLQYVPERGVTAKKLSGGGEQPLTVTPTITEATNGGSYLVFRFPNETLNAGEQIEITFTISISRGIMNTSMQAVNTARATSGVRYTIFEGNKTGAPFKAALGTEVLAGELERALTEALFPDAGSTYGFVGAAETLATQQSKSLLCYMQIKTEQTGGYIGSGASALVAPGGDIHYRMQVYNGGSSSYGMRLMTRLPEPGDQRYNNSTGRKSIWAPGAQALTGLMLDGAPLTPETDYTVYYSTEDVPKTEITGTLAGWTRAMLGADGYPLPNAKAILVQLSSATIVQQGQSLVADYTMQAPSYGAAEMQQYSATLAVGDFAVSDKQSATVAGYSTMEVGSNLVKAELAVPTVNVGGRVWVDADENGLRTGTETATTPEALTFTLHTYRGGVEQPKQTTAAVLGADGYYHFEFQKLYTARPEKAASYNDDGVLWQSLAGSAPYTYSITVTPPAGYKLTTPFHGSKDKPSNKPGALTEMEQTDSNFYAADGTTATSERFFLWSDTQFDFTKDLGLVRVNNLTVKKVSAHTGSSIAGAEFTIYGPFATQPTAAELSAAPAVTSMTTDKKGVATAIGLNPDRGYVLAETKAADGYSAKSATLSGLTAIPGADAAWWLPAGALEQNAAYTVKNSSKTGSLTLSKTDGENPLPGASFTLKLISGGTAGAWSEYLAAFAGNVPSGVDNISIEKDGVSFRLNGAQATAVFAAMPYGTYTLTETAAPEGYILAEAPVTFTLKDGSADVALTGAKAIVNEARAGGTVLQLQKYLRSSGVDGAQMSMGGRTFHFVLTDNATGKPVATAQTNEQGKAALALNYSAQAMGTHSYTLRETAEQPYDGITYDTKTYRIETTVKNSATAGGLTVAVKVDGADFNANTGVLAFTNVYNANGQLALGAHKTLQNGTLKEAQFQFELLAANGTVLDTATNSADGSVAFQPIAYTLADAGKTYTYTIRERVGDDRRCIYDTRRYMVSVKLSDNGGGVLHADATMNGKRFSTADAAFVNVLKPLDLTVYKHAYQNLAKPVSGAGFTLYEYDATADGGRGARVGAQTSGTDGRLTFGGVATGEYVLLETSVPSGYQVLQAQYRITVAVSEADGGIVVTLPNTNRYATLQGSVLCIPNAPRGSGGGGSTGDGGNDNGDGTTTIPEPEIPLASIPDEKVPLTSIPDEEIPLANLPNTGGFSLRMLGAIGALLTVVGIQLSRKKKDE